MPIFTRDMKLQGIHHTSTASYKQNIATRIDLILDSLNTLKSLKYNRELLLLLKNPESLKQEDAIDHANLMQNRFLWWVEWSSPRIHRYDTALERWQKIDIMNLSDFMELEGDTSWSFNWDCRLVKVPNLTVYIIGGVGGELSDVRSD